MPQTIEQGYLDKLATSETPLPITRLYVVIITPPFFAIKC